MYTGPVGKELAPAAIGEVVRGVPDELLDDRVAGEPGLTVGEALAGGRDDVRRIADDEVETLTVNRLVEAAVADVELDPVERSGPPGKLQRAGVHLGRAGAVHAVRQA